MSGGRTRVKFSSVLIAMLVLGFAVWGVATALAAEPMFRMWRDSTGSFKIKAKFVSLKAGTVTLLQEDDNELEIELKKLSKEDQKYVAELKDDDSPFKAKPKSSGSPKSTTKPKKPAGKPAADEEEPAGTETPKTKSVRGKALAARLIPVGTTKSWKVDLPKEMNVFGEKEPQSCSLPPKVNFFEALSGMAINATAKKVAVGYTFNQPAPEGVSRIVLCDLATGETSAPASTSGQYTPLAVHDDGKQILVRRAPTGGATQSDQLEVWDISSGEVSKSVLWLPYDEAKGGPRDVLWAEFLSDTQLATVNRGGKVVVWKYPELRATYSFLIQEGTLPVVSSDRKFIAYAMRNDVGIFDVTKKQVVAQQSAPAQLIAPWVTLSPNGKRLACFAYNKLYVWDVAGGELVREMDMHDVIQDGNIAFPDESCVLIGQRSLIDYENELKLWSYDGMDISRSVGGWTFFCISAGEQPGVLRVLEIPHASAKELAKQAVAGSDEFLLKPGTTVALNLNGVPDAGQRSVVEQGINKQLQANGAKSGPAGQLEIVAVVTGPQEKTLQFFGSPFRYMVKEYFTKVQIVSDGEVIWERSGTNLPAVMNIERGKDVEAQLRAREKPDYTFYEKQSLPKFLLKPAKGKPPGGALSIGHSRLTIAGFE